MTKGKKDPDWSCNLRYRRPRDDPEEPMGADTDVEYDVVEKSSDGRGFNSLINY